MNNIRPPQIIVGIPGTWASRTALMEAIIKQSGGYLFAGIILMDTKTQQSWKMEIYESDSHLAAAFSVAGSGAISESDLLAIASHTMTVYLSGDGGSVEAAKRMMEATAGVLRAGGIAVMSESTGKAHNRQDWMALTESDNPTTAYHAFVTLVGNRGIVYSCGMHNLGLPDVERHTDIPDNDTAQLLETFCLYTLLDQPKLETGHTFSLNPNSPYYRLALHPCTRYALDDPFYNPYGVWRLERI